MKRIFFLTGLLFTIGSSAQVKSASDQMVARKSLQLKDKVITDVQTDTLLASDLKLPTSKAVANYVTSKLAGINGGKAADRANNYFDDARTVNFNAAAIRTGDVLYNLIDNYTGNQIQFQKVTKYLDSSKMNDSKIDGVIYRKKGGEYFKRIYEGAINPVWWGADPTGVANSLPAFKAAQLYTESLSSPVTIEVPEGVYKMLGTRLKIRGNPINGHTATWQATGDVTLNFNLNTYDTVAIQYGDKLYNTVHGGFKKFKIIGNKGIDAISLYAIAPYSTAYNTFEDLEFNNVRDGINTNETISVFENQFNGLIKTLVYSRYPVHMRAGYNHFNGSLFAVSPNGETNPTSPDISKGNTTLAVYDEASSNTYNSIVCEDQVAFKGGHTKVGNLVIEYIMKGKHNPIAGRNGIYIAGAGVSIEKANLITFNNTFIDNIGEIYSRNVSIKNIQYSNPGNNPLFKISYPLLPHPGSSGTMENYDISSTFYLDNPAFTSFVSDWNFNNVKGSGGNFFTRFSSQLTIPAGTALTSAVNLSQLIQVPVAIPYGPVSTFNCAVSLNDSLVLTGNTILTVTNASPGMRGVLVIKQGGRGSYLITSYPPNFLFPGGKAPILSTVVGAKDLLTWYYDGNYYHVNFNADLKMIRP